MTTAPAQMRRGGCLCGAVRFEATPHGDGFYACHCASCRKWSGGPMMATYCGDGVRVEAGEHLAAYPSSEWGERLFCSRCGTSLFWRSLEGADYSVSVFAFDQPDGLRFERQIFIDAKPESYEFANETANMTGEAFHAYVAEQKRNDA